MKIYKMRVENYRGIKDSGWLEFNQMNAIVGKNDAGKSSVLHAINVFYNENKLLEEDRYFGAGDAPTVIEIIFDGEQLLDIPAVLLDNNGKLHIKKSATQVGEAYKNTIIVRDFENASYKNLPSNPRVYPQICVFDLKRKDKWKKNLVEYNADEMMCLEAE